MNKNVLYYLAVIALINKSKYITDGDKQKAIARFVDRWVRVQCKSLEG